MKLSLTAVALALIIGQQQPPTFRTGTNLVRVDVTVIDRRGNPVTVLTADDFDVREDGQPQAITQFKLVEANGQPADELSLPIRGPEHAAAEAARDHVRVFLFFWDEYHIAEFGSALTARQGLTRVMLESFAPTDLVAIMDQLTPTDAVRFTRDRRELANQVHALKGRRGVYFPRSVVEEEHFRAAQGMGLGYIEVLRQQVTASAIQAAAVFLGSLKEGRKSLILVSETLGPPGSSSEYTDVMRDLMRAANDSNTTIYVFDPRGVAVGRRTSDVLDTIAYGTGGQPIVTNDIADRFERVVVNQASAFYLLGYAKEIAADGRFHEIKVRVKRPGLEVRARSGYWAPQLAELTRTRAAAAVAVLPPAVDAAFASLRPLRSRSAAEVWTGTSAGADGRPRVTLAWSPASAVEGAPVAAAGVSVTAAAGGTQIFEGEVAATGTSFAASPGPIQLTITVRDVKGEVIDRVSRALRVPDPASASLALTTPVVARARNPREQRANAAAAELPIHAGRDFERTDRVLLRVAAHPRGDRITVRASLLNRSGATLAELPVERQGTEGGFQIDLPLSNIARGEYVVAIQAASGEERTEAHVPFRLIR